MKKILIVEDDTKIAAALAIRLEAAGYAALTAPDGKAAEVEAPRDIVDIASEESFPASDSPGRY